MKKVLLTFFVGLGLVSCVEPHTENSNEIVIHGLNECVDSLTLQLNDCKESRIQTNVVEVIKPSKKTWCAKELNLPKGRIVKMDCANCNGDIEKRNLKNNYITIECNDGYLRVIRDIDEDLYLNFEVNDSIN